MLQTTLKNFQEVLSVTRKTGLKFFFPGLLTTLGLASVGLPFMNVLGSFCVIWSATGYSYSI